MRRLAAAAMFLPLLTGCSGAGGADMGTDILIFAAASLTDPFREIGTSFHAANPSVNVRFNFGPSDGLATQIGEGAPADVFASASSRWMDAVADDPGVSDRTTFARNRLVVLVPSANPAGIERFEDLTNAGVKLVLAAEGVPVGGYAREALAKAGLLERALRNVVSNEEDVKGVVQRVLLDEADAGIAYQTDLTAAVRDRVRAISIPDAWNVVAPYPVAVLASTAHRAQARAFVAFVLGAGREILSRYGFAEP